jgi:hypothetical protein
MSQREERQAQAHASNTGRNDANCRIHEPPVRAEGRKAEKTDFSPFLDNSRRSPRSSTFKEVPSSDSRVRSIDDSRPRSHSVVVMTSSSGLERFDAESRAATDALTNEPLS